MQGQNMELKPTRQYKNLTENKPKTQRDSQYSPNNHMDLMNVEDFKNKENL